jgi:hypothetical protein
MMKVLPFTVMVFPPAGGVEDAGAFQFALAITGDLA